jgi:hypothetical protein
MRNQPSKFLLVLASPVILGFGHIFVLSRSLRGLKWGLLFDERRGVTNSGHSLSNEE